MGILETCKGFFSGEKQSVLTPDKLRTQFAGAPRFELEPGNWREVSTEAGSTKPVVLMQGTNAIQVRNVQELYKGKGVLTVCAINGDKVVSLKTNEGEVEKGHSFTLNLPAGQSLQEGSVELFFDFQKPVVNGGALAPVKCVVAYNKAKLG